MAIHLTTLGGFQAFRDGVELDRLASKRLRAALLIYLAVERTAAREILTTVFWPESSADNARHALRQCLYHLRNDLGADWLDVRGLELRASPTVRADVQDFIAAIESGDAAAATRLYRGPFLAGMNLLDLQPWEAWVDGKRTQLARAFRKTCRDWVDSLRAQGDLQGAIEAAQRWVVPDPLDDEAQHRLIAALADAGERTAAIRQYETYERLLLAEDLHPLETTTALIEQIRSHAPVIPTPSPALPNEEAPVQRREKAPAEIAAAVSNARTPERPSARAPEHPRARPRPRLLPVAAIVVLAIMGAAWAVTQKRAEARDPSPTDIAVLPFSVRGDADVTYLGDGMVNLLATALDGASVRPVDARAVFAIAAQDDGGTPGLERGARVAARLGAGLFVLGDVFEAGEVLRVEAAVYRAGGASEPVIRGAVSGGARHVFELVDSLAAQLLAGLGAARGDRLTRTAAVTTASLAAFKAYLQGEAEIRAGRFERAEEAYERAIAHDSTFAVAHYRLALARDWAARGNSEEAARAAARHAERLTPRDRALLEALQVYAAGDAPDTERRYRAILARYPDDLEAWLQLGEVLSHYGPVRGRPNAEAEAAWRKVLSYEPKNASAVVHLARIATAAGRSATLDSLLAPFAPAEIQTDRRLQQVAALRAIAQGDTATVRAIVQGAHGWEDAAAWQLAAYLTAFSPVPEGARFAVEGLIDPKRGPGMIADLQWFAALLHLENGQLAAARRARLETLTKKGSMWQYGTFAQVTDWWAATVPVPYADSTLDRIRRSASSSDLLLWNAKASAESRTADAVPLWFALVDEALGVPLRIEALRLYTIGAISLRLRDPDAANTASTALARLAAHEASDWFVRAFDHELRARRAWHAGRPDQALRILDQLELGPVPVGATNVVPFFAGAQLRYLRGELLVAVGRHPEALPWFESLGMLSVPESPFRGPAHLRQAEIHERLGNRSEAAKHYARVLELWLDADPELRPLVDAARQRKAKLK